MSKKDEIPKEVVEFLDAAVTKAGDIFYDVANIEHKHPEGLPPFYVEALGAAYAMALCHAVVHENYEKDGVVNHILRVSRSANESIKENLKIVKNYH